MPDFSGAGGEAQQSYREILGVDPREVQPSDTNDLDGHNFDVRGFAQVTIEFLAGATACDYSWVASGEATGHGYNDDGSAASKNVTATTTKIEVAGSFLRVVPTGGNVRVHRIP